MLEWDREKKRDKIHSLSLRLAQFLRRAGGTRNAHSHSILEMCWIRREDRGGEVRIPLWLLYISV